ncbi:hypothetical protein BaRGS_00035697, partial [Batillaria attramentaria]
VTVVEATGGNFCFACGVTTKDPANMTYFPIRVLGGWTDAVVIGSSAVWGNGR